MHLKSNLIENHKDVANQTRSHCLWVSQLIYQVSSYQGIPSHQSSDLCASKCRTGFNLNSSIRINEPYHNWNCSNHHCFIFLFNTCISSVFVREHLGNLVPGFDCKGCQAGHFKPSHMFQFTLSLRLPITLNNFVLKDPEPGISRF